MAHFNFNPELFGILLNKFSEIDARFGGVEENNLTTVALKLNIGYFHAQVESKGNGTTSFEHFVFLGLGFVIAFHIAIGSHALHDSHFLVVFTNAVFFKLKAHNFAGSRHRSDVETDGTFYYDIIAGE